MISRTDGVAFSPYDRCDDNDTMNVPIVSGDIVDEDAPRPRFIRVSKAAKVLYPRPYSSNRIRTVSGFRSERAEKVRGESLEDDGTMVDACRRSVNGAARSIASFLFPRSRPIDHRIVAHRGSTKRRSNLRCSTTVALRYLRRGEQRR